jgi:hypothetical protein
MMTAMVIGGDHLGSIDKQLKKQGFVMVKHLTGRKNSQVAEVISNRLDLVLVLTDYVGTKLSRVVKNEAKKNDVPVIFARRSWSAISKEMERVSCMNCQKQRKKTCDSNEELESFHYCCGSD